MRIPLCLALTMCSIPALANETPYVTTSDEAPVKKREAIDLSGWRMGATYNMGAEAARRQRELGINPFVTQFGWQFEHRFFEQKGGLAGVNEFLFLLGGMDQAVLLPSASWIVGVRTGGGAEIGAGPVLSVAPMIASLQDGSFGIGKDRSLGGVGFAVAGGLNMRVGDVNFPLNVALVRSNDSISVSMLFGFNMAAES